MNARRDAQIESQSQPAVRLRERRSSSAFGLVLVSAVATFAGAGGALAAGVAAGGETWLTLAAWLLR